MDEDGLAKELIRLVLLYSGTEKRRRAAELCRELLNQGPEGLPESCRPFLALTEAIAWDEAKETAKAREAYTQVIRLYPGTSRAGYAAKRLAAMADEEKRRSGSEKRPQGRR